MAVAPVPLAWFTETARLASVAVTPGTVRVPASPEPWRPNQLKPLPSLRAAPLTLPLVIWRPNVEVPTASWSWLKEKVSSGWAVTAGLVSVTGALVTLKCIDPESNPNTSRLWRSPAALRICVVRVRPAALSAGWVQSIAVAPVPLAWFTETTRLASVAVTPGTVSVPASPEPWRPNQLWVLPSASAAALMVPLVIWRPNVEVPTASWSWLKEKVSSGWAVTAGLVSVTGALVTLKCIEPESNPNTSRLWRSPAALRTGWVQSIAVAPVPLAWFTETTRLASVAVTPGTVSVPASPEPWRPNQLWVLPSASAAALMVPLVIWRPNVEVPTASWSWLKEKVSSGWAVTAGLVSVTGALVTLKCIEPESNPKTSRLWRSPAALRICVVSVRLAALSAGWVQSIAVAPVPLAWLTETTRLASVAVTPGTVSVPASPEPWRPNQLWVLPSASAAALMVPLVIWRPNVEVPTASWSWLKEKVSSGCAVTAGLVSVTGAFVTLKCIEPDRRPKTSRLCRSPAALRICVVRVRLAALSAA